MTFCDLRNPHNLTAEEGEREGGGYIRAERVKMAVCPRLVQEGAKGFPTLAGL